MKEINYFLPDKRKQIFIMLIKNPKQTKQNKTTKIPKKPKQK